jgi:hypothetical protein
VIGVEGEICGSGDVMTYERGNWKGILGEGKKSREK